MQSFRQHGALTLEAAIGPVYFHPAKGVVLAYFLLAFPVVGHGTACRSFIHRAAIAGLFCIGDGEVLARAPRL